MSASAAETPGTVTTAVPGEFRDAVREQNAQAVALARPSAEAAVSTWLGWRVEMWWWLEKRSGRLWERVCKDGVSCRLDWLPAFTYRHRKNAERRRYERKHGVPL